MTETVDNETRAFIEAVQLLEDAGWVVLRPDSKLLRQSDTRIEGGWETPERCFICAKPFKAGELVLSDVTEGLGHRACFGEDREGYVNLETGEPIGPDEPIPTGWPYEVDPAPPAPTPEHVEGDVLSMGEMEVVDRLLAEVQQHEDDWTEAVRVGLFKADDRAAFGDDQAVPVSLLRAAAKALTSATTRIQRAEREIASLTKWKDELLRVEKVQREARFAAEALLREFVAHNDEGPGLIDCIDNDGDRYTSQGLDNTVKATRAFLSTIGERPDAE